jgi:hypothetical protein
MVYCVVLGFKSTPRPALTPGRHSEEVNAVSFLSFLWFTMVQSVPHSGDRQVFSEHNPVTKLSRSWGGISARDTGSHSGQKLKKSDPTVCQTATDMGDVPVGQIIGDGDWSTGLLDCCGGDGYGRSGESAGATICEI